MYEKEQIKQFSFSLYTSALCMTRMCICKVKKTNNLIIWFAVFSNEYNLGNQGEHPKELVGAEEVVGVGNKTMGEVGSNVVEPRLEEHIEIVEQRRLARTRTGG